MCEIRTLPSLTALLSGLVTSGQGVWLPHFCNVSALMCSYALLAKISAQSSLRVSEDMLAVVQNASSLRLTNMDLEAKLTLLKLGSATKLNQSKKAVQWYSDFLGDGE